MELEEAITTQRAIRRLRPDPVGDDVIRRCLEMAVKAPTGGNAQTYEFIVVRDPKVKRALGKQNKMAWTFARALYSRGASDEGARKILATVSWQAEHWDEIPVVIVACVRGMSWPIPWLYRSSRYGSIYPAVQNLLLAAREQELGAALTTLPLWNRVSARRILGLPITVEPVACIPMGWPTGRYGPTTRRAVEDVTHIDRYGNKAWM